MIKPLKVFFEITSRHELLHSDLRKRNIETTRLIEDKPSLNMSKNYSSP